MESWKQYHANGANQGQIHVNTSIVAKPKWSVNVGKIGNVSPVIGADGVIYVGLLSGEFVAVHPNGNIKWKRAVTTAGNPDYSSIITGSPAVGNDKNIYIITTINITRKDRRDESSKMIHKRHSMLHSFTPAGNQRWSYRFQAPSEGLGSYVASSPKIWGDEHIFIFVPVINASTTHKIELCIINQSGNLVNKTEVANYMLSSHFSESDVTINPDPTLAIIDLDQPIIVIDDNYKTLSSYRWNFPILTPLWSHCSEKVRHQTTPAVFANDEILQGSKDGILSCYHVKNGTELHQPWHHTDHEIRSTPILCENNIYLIAGNELIMLNKDFNIQQRFPLSGKCLGSMALSANHIYISTTDGLYTISLDLKNSHKNADIVGGLSTPAISADGTVYVIDQEGTLFAL